MRRSRLTVTLVLAALVAGGALRAARGDQAATPTTLVLDTVKGVIEIELLPSDAPKSVEHIVNLVRKNCYRGQRFHWVQEGVVQFGDPQTRDFTKKDAWGRGGCSPAGASVGVAETSKRAFARGTVGLAYRDTQKPEAADSQLFILRIANPNLNGKYAIIGRVSKGLDVLDKIVADDRIKNVTVR